MLFIYPSVRLHKPALLIWLHLLESLPCFFFHFRADFHAGCRARHPSVVMATTISCFATRQSVQNPQHLHFVYQPATHDHHGRLLATRRPRHKLYNLKERKYGKLWLTALSRCRRVSSDKMIPFVKLNYLGHKNFLSDMFVSTLSYFWFSGTAEVKKILSNKFTWHNLFAKTLKIQQIVCKKNTRAVLFFFFCECLEIKNEQKSCCRRKSRDLKKKKNTHFGLIAPCVRTKHPGCRNHTALNSLFHTSHRRVLSGAGNQSEGCRPTATLSLPLNKKAFAAQSVFPAFAVFQRHWCLYF